MKTLEQIYKDKLDSLTDHVCLNEVMNVFSFYGLDASVHHIRMTEQSLRDYVTAVCAELAQEV